MLSKALRCMPDVRRVVGEGPLVVGALVAKACRRRALQLAGGNRDLYGWVFSAFFLGSLLETEGRWDHTIWWPIRDRGRTS